MFLQTCSAQASGRAWTAQEDEQMFKLMYTKYSLSGGKSISLDDAEIQQPVAAADVTKFTSAIKHLRDS